MLHHVEYDPRLDEWLLIRAPSRWVLCFYMITVIDLRKYGVITNHLCMYLSACSAMI